MNSYESKYFLAAANALLLASFPSSFTVFIPTTAGIPAQHAERSQQFYTAYVNPYWNYQRSWAQANVEIDDKGRKRRRYRRYQTPLETLFVTTQPSVNLGPGLSLAILNVSVNCAATPDAARHMQEPEHPLFEQLR